MSREAAPSPGSTHGRSSALPRALAVLALLSGCVITPGGAVGFAPRGPPPMHVRVDAPVRSSNSRIASATLVGNGWRLVEQSRERELTRFTELRWEYGEELPSMVLWARETDGPTETAERLCARNWADHHSLLFQRLDAATAVQAPHREWPACKVSLDGVGQDGRPLRVVETWIPVPGHLLTIGALGPPEDLDQRAAAIEAWRSSLGFSALGPGR